MKNKWTQLTYSAIIMAAFSNCNEGPTSQTNAKDQTTIDTFKAFNLGKDNWEILTRAYSGQTKVSGQFGHIGFLPPKDSNWTFYEDSLVEWTLYIQSNVKIGKCEKGKVWVEKYWLLDDEFEFRSPADSNCKALEPYVVNKN